MFAIASYASKQFWLNPAIFFSMVAGLASGSRSANKSIQADVFLSALLAAPFLFASENEDGPWIFLKKSKPKMLDCAEEVGLQLLAALLNTSNKQSVSLGSSADMSSKSVISVSFTEFLLPLVASVA